MFEIGDNFVVATMEGNEEGVDFYVLYVNDQNS
jgi:hypothetical protein